MPHSDDVISKWPSGVAFNARLAHESCPNAGNKELLDFAIEEFIDKWERREHATLKSFAAGFPEIAPDLEHRLLDIVDRLSCRLNEGDNVIGCTILSCLSHRDSRFVYLATDHDSGGRVVILKEITSLSRESDIASRVSDVRVARLYRTSTCDLRLKSYAVYEYCGNNTLLSATTLDRRTRMTLLEDVAHAICSIHEQGVVHSDICAHNICVQDGHAKVIDFGSSCFIGDSAVDRHVGSLEYANLQTLSDLSSQGHLIQQASFSIDYFSFYVLCFHTLTGTRPFILSGNNIDKSSIDSLISQRHSLPDRIRSISCLNTQEKILFVSFLCEKSPPVRPDTFLSLLLSCRSVKTRLTTLLSPRILAILTCIVVLSVVLWTTKDQLAISSQKKTQPLLSTDDSSYVSRANSYLDDDRPYEALQMLRKCPSLSTRNKALLAYTLQLCGTPKDNEEITRLYEEVISSGEVDYSILVNYTFSLMRTGKKKRSYDTVKEALHMKPCGYSASALYAAHMSVLENSESDWDEALASAIQAIQNAPDNKVTLLSVGKIRTKMKNSGQSDKYQKQFVFLDNYINSQQGKSLNSPSDLLILPFSTPPDSVADIVR